MLTVLGVDACNTVLGVLIFAAVLNLGQTWTTVLILGGCTKPCTL
jgi:ethanolaminephosphotransferase